MINHPAVSVIMPVYNGATYLTEAIQSILQQTFDNFEFIIIDDGSEDRSVDIIKAFQKSDKRVILKDNEENRGIVYSLNYGISIARGKYVARMDCDDISNHRRLENQVGFLERNPEIGVVGSKAYIIDEKGQIYAQIDVPERHFEIFWNLFFQNPILHPSVMLRMDILQDISIYDECMSFSQDYELWTRLIERVSFHNIQKPLLYYRIHNFNVTNKHRNTQLENSIKINHSFVARTLQKKIPLNVIRVLRSNGTCSQQELFSAFKVIRELARIVSNKSALTRTEQKQLNQFVSMRIFKTAKLRMQYPAAWLGFLLAFFYSPRAVINRTRKFLENGPK